MYIQGRNCMFVVDDDYEDEDVEETKLLATVVLTGA